MTKITVYGRDGCGYCQRAQSLLEKTGLEYDYIKVGVDATAEDVIEKVPDARRTLPIVFWGEEYVGGFDELRGRLEPNECP